ncbi:type II and III secretion system protein, partial [Psychrobacter sp. 16-Bac2893]
NLYQVQTLSGSAASISTGTLYALNQTYTANSYPTYPAYNRPAGRIIIQQQLLLPTSQGIAVTPRLLPNGQVEVQLTQVEEKLVRANPSYNRHGYNSSVQGQRLHSTIIVPRGQWVTIGQISQNSQNQTAGYGGNQNNSRSNDVPISLLVQ